MNVNARRRDAPSSVEEAVAEAVAEAWARREVPDEAEPELYVHTLDGRTTRRPTTPPRS